MTRENYVMWCATTTEVQGEEEGEFAKKKQKTNYEIIFFQLASYNEEPHIYWLGYNAHFEQQE